MVLIFDRELQNRQLDKSPCAQRPWAQLHWTLPFPNLQDFCFFSCTRPEGECWRLLKLPWLSCLLHYLPKDGTTLSSFPPPLNLLCPTPSSWQNSGVQHVRYPFMDVFMYHESTHENAKTETSQTGYPEKIIKPLLSWVLN